MKDNILLKNHESLDDLQVKGYKIIQSNKHFKFSIDAVLLSHYTNFKKNDVVLDMCSGTGIVGILIAAHNQVLKIDCIEIQPELSDMCKRSVKYNDLDNIITPYCMDLKNASKSLGYEIYDKILCNPPYLPQSTGKMCDNEAKTIARFEVASTLKDVIISSSKLLKNKGKLVLSHRAERLCDVIYLMRKHNIEPKRCRFIHSKQKDKATLLLIEGIKNGNSSIEIEAPLYIYNENDNYNQEIYKIYKMDKVKL